MLEEIRELYDYNRWANHRALEATAALDQDQLTRDLGNSFPSVRDTLVHVLSAEWVWLSRWNGTSPTAFPESAGLDTHERIRARWSELEGEFATFLAALTEARLSEVLEYRNTKGEPYAEPLWQLMRHVVNHSTYHRGQITTMLRQLGAMPASTDLIRYFREKETR